tara:strand:+ start:542 stop:949 length:408 start_codon:yes stop_codon:yes gene_type:complete
MGMKFLTPGIGNVGSFQVSGYPYVTGSVRLNNGEEDQIRFPRVAKSVTVINRSDPDLRVHFTTLTANDTIAGKHFISLPTNGDAVTFNIKCKEIYISNGSGDNAGAYEVFAEITGIETTQMPALTGSGLTTADGT